MPRSDSPVKPPIDETQRSRVAPVSHEIRGSSDDFSDYIKKLLAGLEPKIASEAIARAETLGKLPAPQQTALRCALAAASETFKKAEIVQGELAKFKAQQKQAESDRLAESQAFSRRSALADAQVAGLREDLAAQVAANDARESRSRQHRRFLWLALGATVLAGVICAVLLFRPVISPDSSGSEIALHRSGKRILLQPEEARSTTSHPSHDPVVEQALDRLGAALARVPVIEVDNVLQKANQWLMASSTPPCFVKVGEGATTLLVNVKSTDPAPLRTALARCADAVEHVTE